MRMTLEAQQIIGACVRFFREKECVARDELFILPEECVACGMCYNRCPNGNIEMVNTGEKV